MFLDNFIEISIKFGFEEQQKWILHTRVYFQGGCMNVLQIASSFFVQKTYGLL